MSAATVTVTTEVELTPEQLGQLWARMDDDAQARMICAAAAELDRVVAETPGAWLGSQGQWMLAGSHLATCECSTPAGRELVRSLAYGMENPIRE